MANCMFFVTCHIDLLSASNHILMAWHLKAISAHSSIFFHGAIGVTRTNVFGCVWARTSVVRTIGGITWSSRCALATPDTASQSLPSFIEVILCHFKISYESHPVSHGFSPAPFLSEIPAAGADLRRENNKNKIAQFFSERSLLQEIPGKWRAYIPKTRFFKDYSFFFSESRKHVFRFQFKKC